MAGPIVLSNRLQKLYDSAGQLGDYFEGDRKLKLERERQLRLDKMAADKSAAGIASQAAMTEARTLENDRTKRITGLTEQLGQAETGNVMGPTQSGDFQAGMVDPWSGMKDRIRAKMFTEAGTPTTSDQLKAGREGEALGRLRLSQADTRAQEESAADVGYKKALTTKALAEKTSIEKPVKWVSKVDSEGNTYQENPITGETRDTGRKAPIKSGVLAASKEEMRGLQEQAITQIDELLAHPGFSGAVGAKGLSQGFGLRDKPIEGTDEAGFLSRLEQIQGGAFLQARQLLKGGGAITDFESRKAEAAMSRMSAAVGEKEFKLAAKDYKDALEAGIRKLEKGEGSGASGSWSEPKTGSKPKFKIVEVK